MRDGEDIFEDEEKKGKKLTDHESLAVRNMMVNEHGRKFAWEHLQACVVFVNTFDNDPIQHGYKAGLRSAGLQFEAKLKEHEPDYYIKMIKENIDG